MTFVFTDIEGSTRLLQRLGDGYAATLETHRVLLREAFVRHGGVEVNTEGDGLFIAFAAAADAIAACLDGQRAIQEHGWPEGGVVHVRMGVHTGEAQPRERDYVALAVHQAARVAAAGHGGQVLVSDATRHAAGHEMALLGELVPLGRYWLKDFDEPQALFQLTAPGLNADFPALKVASEAGHNLPTMLTRFVGREADVAAVVALIQQARLVTLAGPGGVGKTRLALEAGHRVVGSFPDGVHWCALDSVADPASVPIAIASSVGIREQPGRSLPETIIDRLRGKRVLLVLDNCEHQVDACASLCAQLLQGALGTTVLSTSRERLGLSGETVRMVAPLDIATIDESPTGLTTNPAARLFLDRMTLARGDGRLIDASLTEDDARAVASICRAVDGLPLGLELAAARTRTLSPMQIVSRLDQRLALLASGERDKPHRHQALRRTIDWSYSLLSADEQAAFRRIAVFAGGCTLEAAEQVAGGDIDVLQSLVDKSLVRVADERFSMLQTIRDFALELLEQIGELEEVSRRHAHHFGAVAPELGWRTRRSDPSALLEVDADYDNFIAAFDWALQHRMSDVCGQLVEGLWYPWVRRGATTDGYRRARRALEQSPRPTPDLLSLTGELARFVGDLERAVDLKRAALAAYEADVAPTRAIAAAHTDLAEALIERGDLDEAQRSAERGLGLRREDGNPYGVAHATAALVMLHLARGNHARAAELSSSSIDAFHAAGAFSDLAWACVRAATAHAYALEIEAACDRLRQALDVAEEINETAVMVAALEQVATLAALTRDPKTALRLLGAARAGRASTGFVFRTDERVLEVVGDAVSDDARRALLDEGAQDVLHTAIRSARAVLESARPREH